MKTYPLYRMIRLLSKLFQCFLHPNVCMQIVPIVVTLSAELEAVLCRETRSVVFAVEHPLGKATCVQSVGILETNKP